MNFQLYLQARQLLLQNPHLGKTRLAHALGLKTPAARRMMERYRGETQGHSADPQYQAVLQLKTQQPTLGGHAIALRLGITVDKARLHLARWHGVQAAAAAPTPAAVVGAAVSNVLPPPAPTPAVPTVPVPTAGPVGKAPELQDCVGDATRDLNYLGPKVRTMEELLVYAEVDRGVWEVDRYAINKWDVGAKNPQSGTVLATPLYQIKVWLCRRVVEQRIESLMNGLLDRFKVAAPPAHRGWSSGNQHSGSSPRQVLLGPRGRRGLRLGHRPTHLPCRVGGSAGEGGGHEALHHPAPDRQRFFQRRYHRRHDHGRHAAG